MNKQALKLKQKRKAEREAIKLEKMNRMWDDMTNYSIENGRPQIKKSKEQLLKVYNATRKVDGDILKKTGVVTLVCSLVVLYKEFNFSTNQLLEYSDKLRRFIISLGKSSRSISLLQEEIEKDYNVDILNRAQNLPRLNINEYNKYNMEDMIIKSTVDNYSYFMVITAYTFMNYLSFTNQNICWNHDDLEKFISCNFEFYNKILNDSLYLKTLNDILMNEVCIFVNLSTGSINKIIKQ